MQTAYTTRDSEQDAFDQADQSYIAPKAKLRSGESAEMTESQLERFIEEEGREVLRCLLQGHIDLRNQADVDAPTVTGKDGVERTHRIPSTRTIASIFGEVDSRRAGRGMRGHQMLFVHDAHLNLAAGRYSHEVARRLARMAANMSFEEAQSVLETTAGLSIPKRQAEELVYEAAQDFEAFYQTRTPRVAWELTGARWGLDGAEAMLKLRAICKSKDFEEYWRFHEESERMRNHRCRFEDDAIPNLVYRGEFNHLRTVDRLC